MRTMIGLLLLVASAGAAAELSLEVDVNSVGTVEVYLTNASDSPVTVLTKGLARKRYHADGNVTVRLSPTMYNHGDKPLKQSLVDYHPVVLDPGQTTWIQHHGVSNEGHPETATSLTVVYAIDQTWGNLHATWHGTAEAPPIPLKNGAFDRTTPGEDEAP